VQRELVDVLMNLAGDAGATVEARAAAEWGLRRIAARADQVTADAEGPAQAHLQLAAADIQRFLDRRYEGGARSDPLAPPSGVPIGN
jgi:hypothetical protein